MSKFRIFAVFAVLLAPLFAVGSAGAASLGAADKVMDKLAINQDIVNVKGCHKQARRHWVNKWGVKRWHRHGYNCQPRPVKKKWKGGHCHRGFGKHFHGGWGGGWHRHRGPNCVPRRGKAHKGYRKGCFKVGPVWVCP